MMKRILAIFLFLSCVFIPPSMLAGEPRTSVITGVERGRIQIDSKEWVELLGVDMRNLQSKKKSSFAFADEVDGYLKSLMNRKVIVEYDPSASSWKKMGYLYYFTEASHVSTSSAQGPGVSQVLVVDGVHKKNKALAAKVSPYLKILLNLEIIRKGYGRVEQSASFKLKKQFLIAEKEAELNQAGIWG